MHNKEETKETLDEEINFSDDPSAEGYIKMSMRDGRPTFYYNNESDNRIRAAGLLIYRFTKHMLEPEYLMINSKGKYEDFGGKTDIIDSCIDDTVIREADEESNGVIDKESITKRIKNSNPVYCNRSKYLVYVIRVNKYYNPTEFGDREIHDNIPRTVEWVKHSDLWNCRRYSNSPLHMRLKFDELYTRINKNYKRCIKQKSNGPNSKKQINYYENNNKKRTNYMFI